MNHIDGRGMARMADVGEKPDTEREAVAEATLRMNARTVEMILDESLPKGDVLAAARIAGITAAKRTSEIIPLCHPIQLTFAGVDIAVLPAGITVTATVRCCHKTGVEMEALSAASAAALTLYDMCKAVDRSMSVENIHLVEKRGGRSGEYHSPARVYGLNLLEPNEKRPLSLMDCAAVKNSPKDGLCVNKFRANIVTSGLDYSRLTAGQSLAVGGAVIEVISVGKNCYAECPDFGKKCELRDNCAFAKLVCPGEVSRGDIIE